MKISEIPQRGIRTEIATSGSRIVFEQEPGNEIFVAEYLHQKRLLDCHWPCSYNFNTFSSIVGINREADWSERSGVRRGTLGIYQFWFDSAFKGNVHQAGVQIKITGIPDSITGVILEKIAEIASKTITKQANLPPNLTIKLKEFVDRALELAPK